MLAWHKFEGNRRHSDAGVWVAHFFGEFDREFLHLPEEEDALHRDVFALEQLHIDHRSDLGARHVALGGSEHHDHVDGLFSLEDETDSADQIFCPWVF